MLHFAARSLVGESVAKPESYWNNNVVGTVALLDAVRAHGVPRFVFSSSAATYGDTTVNPITEDLPPQPTNPYGASKLAVDMALDGYAEAHGFGAVSLRYFNVAGAHGAFGERHAVETHLIPIALQVAAGRAESLRSTAPTTPPPTAPACATTSTSSTWPTPTSGPWTPAARTPRGDQPGQRPRLLGA